MKNLKQILLTVLMCFTFSSYSLAADSILGEDYWPFPWGTECPFPWTSISQSPWVFELNEERVEVSFHVGTRDEGVKNIVTVVYNENFELLAYGQAFFPESSKIISLKLQNNKSKSYFNLLLRLYSKDNSVLPGRGSFSVGEKNSQMSCRNSESHVMALTVTTSCFHRGCAGRKMKHQVIDHVKP